MQKLLRKILMPLLSWADRQTASEWNGLIEARNIRPLEKKVDFAFSCLDKHGNERRFYTWQNPLDRPPMRTVNYAVRMSELSMGVDREVLTAFVGQIKEIISGKQTIDLGKIGSIIYAIETRMILAPFEDHLYWAAACEFFELSEDLEDFNFVEQESKIKLWKRVMPSASFFLQTPLKNRLLSAEFLLQDLANRFKMQELEIRHQTRLFPFLNSE